MVRRNCVFKCALRSVLTTSVFNSRFSLERIHGNVTHEAHWRTSYSIVSQDQSINHLEKLGYTKHQSSS